MFVISRADGARPRGTPWGLTRAGCDCALASDAHLGLTTDLTPASTGAPGCPEPAGEPVSRLEWPSLRRVRPLPGPVLPPATNVPWALAGSLRPRRPVECERGFLRCFRFCVRCLLCFRPRQLHMGSGRGSRRAAGQREQGLCPSSPSPSPRRRPGPTSGVGGRWGCLCGHLSPGHRQTSVEGLWPSQSRPARCPPDWTPWRKQPWTWARAWAAAALQARDGGHALPCTVLSWAACGLPLPKAERRIGLGRAGAAPASFFFFIWSLQCPSLTVPPQPLLGWQPRATLHHWTMEHGGRGP